VLARRLPVTFTVSRKRAVEAPEGRLSVPVALNRRSLRRALTVQRRTRVEDRRQLALVMRQPLIRLRRTRRSAVRPFVVVRVTGRRVVVPSDWLAGGGVGGTTTGGPVVVSGGGSPGAATVTVRVTAVAPPRFSAWSRTV
jgi:hypothetical protein